MLVGAYSGAPARLAVAYLNLKQYDEALAILQPAAKVNPLGEAALG